MISPELEGFLARLRISIPSSHVVMLSHPLRVAAFVVEAARKIGSGR
jgi:hypothetical protein